MSEDPSSKEKPTKQKLTEYMCRGCRRFFYKEVYPPVDKLCPHCIYLKELKND